MKRDLETLLRDVDATLGPPPLEEGLAERVRRIHKQRRQTWAAGMAVAAVVLLGVGIHLVGRGLQEGPHDGGPQYVRENPAGTETASDATAQLVALLDEARGLREAALAALDADLELSAIDGTASADEATVLSRSRESIDHEIEKTAYLAVYQGDRLRRELGLAGPAAASYRRAVELFPDTRAAEVAKNRLAELENSKGDPS